MRQKGEKLLLIGATIMLILGLINWMDALLEKHSLPSALPAKDYQVKDQVTSFSTARYQTLFGGRLFFGKQVISEARVEQFSSNIIVWGIIFGQSKQALVSNNRSGSDTFIVKPGDIFEENIIKAIGENYIIVSNQSGEGKVFIKEN